MFVAIDRVSKFAFAELHEKATRRIAADFLRRLTDAVPYKIHTAYRQRHPLHDARRQGIWRPGHQGRFRAHAFELTCARNDIEHRAPILL